MTPADRRAPVRVVIADESPFVSSGLRAALEAGGLVVVANCASAENVFVTATALRPDAVLLSATLPGGAADAVRRIRSAAPETEFVLLADDAGEDEMLELVASGVHGILLGATDPARLPLAVVDVVAGGAAFPRRLVRAMADELSRRDGRRRLRFDGGPVLTSRESQVVEALAQGRTSSEVARDLGISAATVRRHAANVGAKLGVGDRAEMLRLVRLHLEIALAADAQ